MFYTCGKHYLVSERKYLFLKNLQALQVVYMLVKRFHCETVYRFSPLLLDPIALG